MVDLLFRLILGWMGRTYDFRLNALAAGRGYIGTLNTLYPQSPGEKTCTPGIPGISAESTRSRTSGGILDSAMLHSTRRA